MRITATVGLRLDFIQTRPSLNCQTHFVRFTRRALRRLRSPFDTLTAGCSGSKTRTCVIWLMGPSWSLSSPSRYIVKVGEPPALVKSFRLMIKSGNLTFRVLLSYFNRNLIRITREALLEFTVCHPSPSRSVRCALHQLQDEQSILLCRHCPTIGWDLEEKGTGWPLEVVYRTEIYYHAGKANSRGFCKPK